jgi:hypothetical protein
MNSFVVDCAGNHIQLLNKDIAYGTSLELSIIETLSKYFNEAVEKVKYRYSQFDAFSATAKYEIKSRRNRYDQYPTTIVAVDKTANITDRLVFVFHFTDGLYFIEYNAEKFSAYDIRDVEAVRTGGIWTSKPHFFIPIQELTRINI